MSSHHQVVSGRAILSAETVGRGDPVVFLHAGVCDRRMWRALLESVAAGNRAIAYDRRGFGETRAEAEAHSTVADLLMVVDRLADGEPVVLAAGSQGGRIAIDAALQHPSRIRGLFLVAPTVSGAPEAVYPREIALLIAGLKQAGERGDLEKVNKIKARLWLDGPLADEGRVTGQPRQLFMEMNVTAQRSPPTGPDLDAQPAFPRLAELSMPSLVVWGKFDFPHIQERCRRIVSMMPGGSGIELTDAAHLPSLEKPAIITSLLAGFLRRCSAR